MGYSPWGPTESDMTEHTLGPGAASPAMLFDSSLAVPPTFPLIMLLHFVFGKASLSQTDLLELSRAPL